ncbi:guanitoxin biosynthesis heme-dependent pre-guanitoxin N-hydroxylase GntA [Streptomyces sp. NPDC006265]|uniref:guanitoxin biosynthesis heme-dependent pre-guanitoxin N-hydroxylase GntA n=1 Tax=Streptomyces sp. NPDC006265 TaxID=3156740 RepID=UPI0033B9B7C4
MSPESQVPEGTVRNSCHGVQEGRLVRLRPEPDEPDALAVLVHHQFRAMMLSGVYTCLGGSAAIRQDKYRLGLYGPLSSTAAIDGCADDLRRFTEDFPRATHAVAVFVAVFDGPLCVDEVSFERVLWDQLRGMNRVDGCGTGEPVTLDGGDDGVVFADRRFFVVGLHPAASRWARRFAWPTLVFNALTHDELLRSKGQQERMRDKIRSRDVRLQGSVNPAVDLPRIAQFAGRMVDSDWRPPTGLGTDAEYGG